MISNKTVSEKHFKEGELAYLRGYLLEDNPHSAGTIWRNSWFEGWMDCHGRDVEGDLREKYLKSVKNAPREERESFYDKVQKRKRGRPTKAKP